LQKKNGGDYMANKIIRTLILIICLTLSSTISYAAITEQQGEDLAEFAKRFVEEGNARKDENGFPLLTYGLTGSWNENVKIRNSGYNEILYNVTSNPYYTSGGRYMNLGNKWMMDCGTFVTYTLKKTVGLVVYNGSEPWHVQDIYNDACKGENSQYFEFVYPSVAVGNIDFSKLRKGDVIARITGGGNHGMVYVGDGYIAHANRDMIRSWGNDKVSGFAVNKINNYFLSGTVVRIMRIKDGVIPEDYVSNSIITWPDTGETVDLLGRADPATLRPGVTSNDLVIEQRIKEEEALLEEQNKLIIEKFTQEAPQKETLTSFTIRSLMNITDSTKVAKGIELPDLTNLPFISKISVNNSDIKLASN